MDYKIAYTSDILAQAEQCFNDKQLTYSFLKYIKQNSENQEEAKRKLKILRARIGFLENKAKQSFYEILDMERIAKQEQIEQEQRHVFTNDEIFNFFIDDKNNEYLTFLKENATLDRINLAIRQLETLRTQSDKLIRNLRKNYPKMQTINQLSNNININSENKTKQPLQLDRGFYKDNTGRF